MIYELKIPIIQRLRRGECAVFYCIIPSDVEQIDLDDTVLSQLERDRSINFHHRIDKIRFIAGRILTRHVLARSLGCTAEEIQLELSNGKPFLSTHHQSNLEFNITHSGRLIMVCFTKGHEIGIDTEIGTEKTEVSTIARRVMTDSEYDEFSKYPAENAADHFYRLWVRKEAILKCLGTGFSVEPDRLSVGLSELNTIQVSHQNNIYYVRNKIINIDDKKYNWALAMPIHDTNVVQYQSYFDNNFQLKQQ